MISLILSRCQEVIHINFLVRNKLGACSKSRKIVMLLLLEVFFNSISPRNFHTRQTHGTVLRIWKIHLQKTTAAWYMMKNFNETQQDIKRTKRDWRQIWQCLTFPDSSSWMNTNGFGATWKTGRDEVMNERLRSSLWRKDQFGSLGTSISPIPTSCMLCTSEWQRAQMCSSELSSEQRTARFNLKAQNILMLQFTLSHEASPKFSAVLDIS